MRSRGFRIALLLFHSLPFAFLAMHLDVTNSVSCSYIFLLLLMCILGFLTKYDPRQGILAHALSFAFSCLLLLHFADLRWNAYFKPFGVMGTATILQGYGLLIQSVIWNWGRERGTVGSFFYAVSLTVLGFSALIIGVLFVLAMRAGAV